MGYRDIVADVIYTYGVVLDLDEFLHFLMIYDKNPKLLKIKDIIDKYIAIKQKERDVEENDELTDDSDKETDDECEEDIDDLNDTIWDTLWNIGIPNGTRYTINSEKIFVHQMPHDSEYNDKIVLGVPLPFDEMKIKIYDSVLDMFGDYEKHDLSFLSQFTGKTPKLIVARSECTCCT